MIQGIERYLKQAIVDKNPSVASSALVSSGQLQRGNPELVKRWVNEVQEAVSSDNWMVQYHALGLLYSIRKADKLAVTKLVAKFTKQSPLRSPYAQCLLVSDGTFPNLAPVGSNSVSIWLVFDRQDTKTLAECNSTAVT